MAAARQQPIRSTPAMARCCGGGGPIPGIREQTTLFSFGWSGNACAVVDPSLTLGVAKNAIVLSAILREIERGVLKDGDRVAQLLYLV